MEIVPIFSSFFLLVMGGLYFALAVYLIYCIHRLRVEAERQSQHLQEIKELLRLRTL
ncbi:MAG: hypothetical protein RhofKO_09420 [Rhodothermales bacterium]